MSDKLKELQDVQEQIKKAMHDERAQHALMEKGQIKVMMKYVDRKRLRFEYAEASQYLLQDKNDIDIMLIMDKIVDWSKSAKTKEQKKTLTDLFLAILRIQYYVKNLETLNQHCVANYAVDLDRLKESESHLASKNLRYENEIRGLKKELENAKKEIEFIAKNG